MLNRRTRTCRLLPVATLLALSPALPADESCVTLTNATRMNLNLRMDPGAEEGLEVCAAVGNDPWTFTGGSQADGSLDLAPGTLTTFYLAPGARNEGSMVFQVRSPAEKRVAGNGDLFHLTFRTEFRNGAQRAMLATDLNDQALEMGGAYTYFYAFDDGARGLRIDQADLAEVSASESEEGALDVRLPAPQEFIVPEPPPSPLFALPPSSASDGALPADQAEPSAAKGEDLLAGIQPISIDF